MSEFFHEGSRQLQDRFETRPMADRLVEAIISNQISPEDKAFIEEQTCFSSRPSIVKGARAAPTKAVASAWLRLSMNRPWLFRFMMAAACICRPAMCWLTSMSAYC